MKKSKWLWLLLVAGFMSCYVVAGDAKDEDRPPWMEDVKVNGKSTYLVPKGAKRKVIGAQIVVEPPNEYVARRIYEMEMYLEKRLKEIERSQEGLRKQFEELKKIVENLTKKETAE